MKSIILPRNFGILVTIAASINLAAGQNQVTTCATTQRPDSTPKAIDLSDRGIFYIDKNGTTTFAEAYYQPEPYTGFLNWIFDISANGQLNMTVLNYLSERVIACYNPPQSETCVWLDKISGCRMGAPITGDLPTAVEEFSVYAA